MNGQHVVEIAGDSAMGIAYCQVKLVGEEDSNEVITDSSTETLAAEEALAAMPQIAAELGTDPDVVDRLHGEYEEYLQVLRVNEARADADPALRHDRQYTALRLALLARKRSTVVRLRDERRIDDIVLRQIQAALDIEEVRLSRRELVE